MNRPPPRRRNTPPGRIRIIGGRWRHRLLPVATLPELRPTPDRARETLFNWLAPQLPSARCLDLFAGSGALGLEAISRGASRAVLVEHSPRLCRQLREQGHLLQAEQRLQVQEADATTWLLRNQDPFDIIFLDPPYDSNLLIPCCETLLAQKTPAPDALFYLESDAAAAPPKLPPDLRLLRQGNAGRSRLWLAAVKPRTPHAPMVH